MRELLTPLYLFHKYCITGMWHHAQLYAVLGPESRTLGILSKHTPAKLYSLLWSNVETLILSSIVLTPIVLVLIVLITSYNLIRKRKLQAMSNRMQIIIESRQWSKLKRIKEVHLETIKHYALNKIFNSEYKKVYISWTRGHGSGNWILKLTDYW